MALGLSLIAFANTDFLFLPSEFLPYWEKLRNELNEDGSFGTWQEEDLNKRFELLIGYTVYQENKCLVGVSENYPLNITRYTGFWGGLRKPPKEAEIKRFCNQLS